MALPKTTQERIKADAYALYRGKPDNYFPSNYKYVDGYIAGASAENERAQKLASDIQMMLDQCDYNPELSWYEIICRMKGIGLNALQQWNSGKEVAYKGSVITEPAPGISLGCISPEARELLDTIMEQWEKHYASMKEMHGDAMPETTFYGFAYWLVRWSGLVQPAGKEAEEPKPEGWPWICEHCGKQDCESDHK